jgi:putative peptide zinc metalloprotease protein
MASFGRRVEKAGFKLVAIFPYAFVDTSEAWFEPRRRRIAISAAGPVSDFALGATFSICCLALPKSTVRDIFFNLAFAAYVGGFFNLNPFIERDGYHILVDYLREPGLRRRAKEQFARRLAGRGASTDSPVLGKYSLWGLGWSTLAALFAIGMSLRYEKTIVAVSNAPQWVVDVVMGTLWVAFFLPVIVVVGKPLLERMRGVEPAAPAQG